MTIVTYRPLQRRDHDAVKSMIDEAFQVHRYATSPVTLASALEVYLRGCLAASTYSQVAEVDGKAVGLILGRISGSRRLPGRALHKLVEGGHTVIAGLTALTGLPRLMQQSKFTDAYRELRKEVTTPLSDEITLFVVDSSTRGLGVGKTLFSNLMAEFRRAGRRHFFLYTDTFCTYGFYEHQGMTRAAERTIRLDLGAGPEDVGVYLYTGVIEPAEHSAPRRSASQSASTVSSRSAAELSAGRRAER